MSERKPLRGDIHIQQFPNAEHYLGDDTGPNPQWWELPETPKAEGFAKGGSVISRLRSRPDQMLRVHPAMNIPGVHIRTADAGEPIFHGDE